MRIIELYIYPIYPEPAGSREDQLPEILHGHEAGPHGPPVGRGQFIIESAVLTGGVTSRGDAAESVWKPRTVTCQFGATPPFYPNDCPGPFVVLLMVPVQMTSTMFKSIFYNHSKSFFFRHPSESLCAGERRTKPRMERIHSGSHQHQCLVACTEVSHGSRDSVPNLP